MSASPAPSKTAAVAVYCASSTGNEPAYVKAADSLGTAIAKAGRPLVYGGGSKGLMGTVSGAVLNGKGKVTGVVPYAMVAQGGEGEKSESKVTVELNEKGREAVETIVVNSMHDRKVEMARRAEVFFGLPGGFGTFEEVMEVSTWTQLGIHRKPVILLNVLGYYDPLRQMIKNGISAGFIQPYNESIILFVDGPTDRSAHAAYDWGKAALDAIDEWYTTHTARPLFNWVTKEDGKTVKTMSDAMAFT
ncbi:uncharacterized protein SCHCODRAFT_02604665 [Schizophyllum commune H4-8]|nr:uncharacterized protein SCHCODRAFT_02604665 [Schizophyllum commune H4-8]KAI5899268.1 hypothetical protein SCHCODRAFT_02604665 [Schizophyllum commune H4-8]